MEILVFKAVCSFKKQVSFIKHLENLGTCTHNNYVKNIIKVSTAGIQQLRSARIKVAHVTLISSPFEQVYKNNITQLHPVFLPGSVPQSGHEHPLGWIRVA